MANNRTTTTFGTTMDKIRRAKQNRMSAETVEANRSRATREDIKRTFEFIHGGKEYIKKSNDIVVNKKTWKNNNKYATDKITPKLNQKEMISFFDVIANKTQDAKEFLGITIENLENITVANQIGMGNESLVTWQDSINYFKENVENKGKIIAWDLETIGGKDVNGVWRPIGITEFSMQEYDYATQKITKTNVLVGMTKEEGDKLYDRLITAINNGTIDNDEELKVTAQRMAKYGSPEFKKRFIEEKGYYEATSFPAREINNWKDAKLLRRGVDHFIEAGTDPRVLAKTVDGIRPDQRAIGEAFNYINVNLRKGDTLLTGFNDSKFDKPIADFVLTKWGSENENFKKLFVDGIVGLDVKSKQWLDILGGVQLYTSYNSISSLYPGMDISGIDKIRGQEYLAQMFLPHLFEKDNPNALKPHMAEDDVTALLKLITEESKEVHKTFLEHLNTKLEKIETERIELAPNKHILAAKKSIMNDNYGGRNFFNFAHDITTGQIYTADNHVIENGSVYKEGFSTGFGVNKGHMYDILDISKFTPNAKMREMLGDISPEYSGREFYRVQLKMTTHSNYKNRRMDNLVQNIIFKNEKEMKAFMAGNFDVVAEHIDDNDIKIYDDAKEYFDRRELKKKNGKASFQKLDVNLNDKELFENKVLANNQKIITSRADNAIFGKNSYKKLSQTLELKKQLEETLGYEVKGQDIVNIMSKKVSQGQMPLELNNEVIMEARNVITTVLGYEKDNVQKLLASTVDNFATGIDLISTHEKMITNIMNSLNQIEGFSKKSAGYKQELFSRIMEKVKYTAADYVYKNQYDTQDMMILGDQLLQASFKDLKNIYEIDYTPLLKGDRFEYVDVANPLKYANVLKLDLSNKNAIYDLINTSTKIIHGEVINDKVYKKDAILKMFSMLNEDRDLRKTRAFKNFKQQFQYDYGTGKFKKGVHHEQIAETILQGMKEIKSHNATKGFINVDHAFMKAVSSHKAFGAILNSEGVLNQIPGIVKDIADNFQYTELKEASDIKTLAKKIVKQHYMPDYEVIKKAYNFDDESAHTIKSLYKNINKDLTKFMEKVLKGFSSIEGTSISIQDNGEFIVSKGDRIIDVNKYIPKIGFDEASNTLYQQIGSMKTQIGNALTFEVDGRTVKGGTRSSIGFINDYDFSKRAKYLAENKSADEALDSVEYSIRRIAKDLRQKSTINGFSGNDIDANYSVDVSNIKNVLVEMFGENGKLNYMVNDVEFVDKELVQTLKKDFSYIVSKEKTLEDLGAETTRNLAKNVEHLLTIIREKGMVSSDFDFLSRDLGFTGSEKKTSSLIAMKGYRPYNSTLSLFDNVQRPPVTQSGNAYQLRVDRILEANRTKHMDLGVGNVISTTNMEKRLLREYSGIGRTTTDVMMNIAYMDTNSLNVLVENNFEKIINNNTVDMQTKKQLTRAYNFVKDSINVFEQERIIDSRVHEAVYGLQTARTQKLSKNYDIVNVFDNLKGKDYDDQVSAILDFNGKFSYKNGELKYKASHGKIVKRGESAIKWKGFADLNSSFVSKVQNGVFNYNYYNSNGVKLTEKEINEIIQKNKSFFKFDKDKPLLQSDMAAQLNKLLSSKGIIGQFAIEDISAIGYVKTMTSGVEKGMTDVIYASTGSYDERVKKFFQEINAWDMVKSKVLTNEAIDALYYRDKKLGNKALQAAGFKSFENLKSAIESERHIHSALLFDKILDGKAHVIANDAVMKHGNVGQMYQGTLSKAINSLTKKYNGDQEKAVDFIINKINDKSKDYQFINNLDLEKGLNAKDAFSKIGVINRNGTFLIDDNFKASTKQISTLNNTKFENLIKAIDEELKGLDDTDRLVRHNVYVMNEETGLYEKRDIIGSFNIGKKDIVAFNKTTKEMEEVKDADIIMGTNTRETLKYVRDSETQSGVTEEYFELRKARKNLKREKIEIEKKLQGATKGSKERANLEMQLLDIKNKIDDVSEGLAAYDGAIKTMKFGDQELSILERVSITEAHAEKINDLIISGEVSKDSFLNSAAFESKVTLESNGRLKFSDDVIGEKSLLSVTDQFRKNQFYDKNNEELFTKDMLKDKEYLKDIYEYVNSHGKLLGEETAEKLYNAKLADKGARFNEGLETEEAISKIVKGYEKRDILDLHFNAEDIVDKNIIADLGEEFGDDRFLAIPGLGMKVGDEEIKKEAHKKLINLQNIIGEIKEQNGDNSDGKIDKLINRALDVKEDAIDAVNKTIYGKNGVMHSLSRLEIDAVSYRLKASGIISGSITNEMLNIADIVGVDLSDGAEFTRKAMINGKTIYEQEQSGEAFYKYKFMAREQFENAGYFTEEKLKQYGFLDENGDMQEAIAKMEEFLKTHGTYDISDRYPNTRNESISATRVFLGEGLAGNQVKVSTALMLGGNGDQDGDSWSSFMIGIEDEDGKIYDGGLYELAKKEAKNANANSIRDYVIQNELLPEDVYDKFASIERGMISDAHSFSNKNWQVEALEKMKKDFIKNQFVSNPKNMALVPGGKSILSELTFANIQHMPTLEEFNVIEKGANEILQTAKRFAEENAERFDVDISKTESAKILDDALKVLKDAVNDKKFSEETFKQMETTAIQRAVIDRYSQEIMAKTGLAATGSVNLALNSVKLADYFSHTDAKDVAFTNYVWSALDTAEQGVISSKKIDGSAIYNDKRISNFKDAMRSIFDGSKGRASETEINQLVDWLNDYGDGVFEVAYKKMGQSILNEDQLKELSNIADSRERIKSGTTMMRNAFVDKIKSMTSDDLFYSYFASAESMGRNGHKVSQMWWNNSFGAAAAEGKSLASAVQGAMGYADEAQLKAILSQRAQEEIVQQEKATAKKHLTDTVNDSAATAKAAIESVIDEYSKISAKAASSSGGGAVGKMGMLAIGVAAGLMVGGYASGNPLNDKSAEQVNNESAPPPQTTMSIPDFMEKESGYVTGNTQQGYIINIRADTKKGRKHLEKIMSKAAEATVGGAVSVNMNIRNIKDKGITDSDVENYINRFL